MVIIMDKLTQSHNQIKEAKESLRGTRLLIGILYYKSQIKIIEAKAFKLEQGVKK